MAPDPDILIGRPDDPRIAGYRSLSDGDLFRRRGLFVAEGRLVVTRLLREAQYAVQSLLLNPAARRALAAEVAALNGQIPIYVAETDVFAAITGFNIHRGCLALAARPADASPLDVIRSADLVLVLEGVANADNVGAAFRNAAAFGAGAVLLDPASCDPLYRKAIRTSMAATLRVPFARVAEWPDMLSLVRHAGFELVALVPQAPVALDTFAERARTGPRRTAFLVGAEGPGLSRAALEMADVSVSIPMASGIDSLNLAVATGIALSRFRAARLESGA
jgi:tRNA G18 (ribose-2'-O)-methylase SpoU